MKYSLVYLQCLLIFTSCEYSLLNAQVLDEHELLIHEQDLALPELENSPVENLPQGSEQSLINLNTVEPEELRRINLLEPEIIQKLLEYLADHRPLASIYELQSPGLFNKDQLKRLMGVCFVEQDQSFRSAQLQSVPNSSNQLILRWDKKLFKSNEYLIHDSIPSAYLGSPDRLILRLNCSFNSRLKSNVIMEKDAGEPWLTGRTLKLPDHLSVNLQLSTSNDYFKNIIVGDFGVKFGRGLIMDNASFLINSNAPSTISYRPQSFIKANTSLSETGFLRGLGVQSILKNDIELISFISHQYLDANLETTRDSLGNERLQFSSLNKSGYHRTVNELKSKKILNQWLTGVSLNKILPSGHIGLNLIYSKYGINRKDFEEISKRDIPTDGHMGFGSLYYSLRYRQIINTGEAAMDKHGHFVVSHSSIIAFGKKASLLLTGYYYSPGFYTEQSKVESTSGYSWNEKGLRGGLDIRFNKYWSFIISSGMSHQVLTDQLLTGPKDTRMRFELHWTKRKNSKFRYQLQISNKGHHEQEFSSQIQKFEPESRFIGHQIYYEKQLTDQLMWRFRLQWSGTEILPQNSSGWFCAQDINGRLKLINLKFWLRFSYFDTNFLKINFYAFENDLRYQYSISSFTGRGLKSYLKLGIKIKNQWTLESKISLTIRYNSINSVTSENNAPASDWEIKSQIIYNF